MREIEFFVAVYRAQKINITHILNVCDIGTQHIRIIKIRFSKT